MHDEPTHSRNELWLARQLRDAARRERLQFSEALHGRIMQATRPVAASETVLNAMAPVDCAGPISTSDRAMRASLQRRNWWRLGSLTAAAAIAAMAIASRSFYGTAKRCDPHVSPSTTIEPVVAHPIVKPGRSEKPASRGAEIAATQPIKPSPAHKVRVNDANVESGTSVHGIATAAANYTLDDLSRDAKATAHVLVDQLPFETPADEWGL